MPKIKNYIKAKSLSSAALKNKCRFLMRPCSATYCMIDLTSVLSRCHFRKMMDNASLLLCHNDTLTNADNVQLK